MASMRLRCDDVSHDRDALHCRRLWELAHAYGFKQLLACVPAGLTENVDLVEAVKKSLDEGDALGMHGYHHVYFTKMSAQEQKDDIKKGLEVLSNLFGVTPLLFVAPFNGFNETTIRVAHELGMILEMSKIDFRVYTLLQETGEKNPDYVVYHPQYVTPESFEEQLTFLRNSLK